MITIPQTKFDVEHRKQNIEFNLYSDLKNDVFLIKVPIFLTKNESLGYFTLLTNIQMFGKKYWITYKKNNSNNFFNNYSNDSKNYIKDDNTYILNFDFIRYIDDNIDKYERAKKLEEINEMNERITT